MRSSLWCTTCNAYHLPGTHLPSWDVWEADGSSDRGDYKPIHAATPEGAVERWARNYDYYGDYTIVSGETLTVLIAPHASNHPPLKYHVSGETVAEYHAHEVEE